MAQERDSIHTSDGEYNETDMECWKETRRRAKMRMRAIEDVLDAIESLRESWGMSQSQIFEYLLSFPAFKDFMEMD